jgi:hypothetical protein
MAKPKKSGGKKLTKDLNAKGGGAKVVGGLRKAGGTNP